METKRLIEINKGRNEIRNLEKYIQTDLDTINRFRGENSNDPFYKNQIDKLREKNIQRNDRISELKTRMSDIHSGHLDSEINTEYNDAHKEVIRKTNEKLHKKQQENEDQKILNVKSVSFYKENKDSDRKERATQREIDRTYKYYNKICDSIPDYLLRKLENMPNNKGYIWRGMFCYGELPAEKNRPVVLFETHKGIMTIHEWVGGEYKVWKKEGKNRKTLFSVEKTRSILRQETLSDYVTV